MQESAQPTALPGRAHEPAAGLWWRILSRFGIEVRSSETRVVSALHLYCFLLGAFQFASKSVRQSTFVDSLGSEKLPYVYLLVPICAFGEEPQAGDQEKLVSGMSIVGNDEAPKSLVIVPWKSADLGNTLDVLKVMDDGRRPVDREVFLRALDYYEIRTGSAR